MRLYTAIVLNNLPAFQEAVERVYPGNNLKIGESSWLIAGTGTAQEVCGSLGMPTTPGAPAPFSAMIAGISGYYGFMPSNIWEWVAAKQAIDG